MIHDIVESLVSIYSLFVFRNKKMVDTYFDKETEKAFVKASEQVYEQRVSPGLLMARETGNMYTASLYGGIVSLLAQ